MRYRLGRGGSDDAQAGFSLTELLIVLVIIGVLALLAIPRFFEVTTRAKTTEAKLMLKQVHTLQQAYYFEHDRYAAELAAIGFDQSRLVADGGTARYTISIEQADGSGFTAIATSTVDFNNNGVFNVWEVDHEGMIRQRVAD
jgi:type IV pilus assembly protein PilE